jgi:hypothetical protein
MLNGIDPVIIFQFKKILSTVSILEENSSIPVLSTLNDFVVHPPIPVYLSERLTGLFIDTEDKSIDIETDVQTKSNAETPDVNQKGIQSIISITIQGKKNSIGISLLSAFCDQIFQKLSSKEYSISYLHGATTVFGGLLHNFKLSQNANTDLVQISIELTKGTGKPTEVAPNDTLAGSNAVIS